MADLIWFNAVSSADAPRVGGKAASLASMTVAGLPVPNGFVIPTSVYQRLHSSGVRSDPTFTQALLQAFQKLAGPVAVRSSATGEDGQEASFAGQQETILGVATDDELITAIERCWASLQTDRAVAYRQKQGLPSDALAMAVVIQKLIPAATAGVLFTQDPAHPKAGRMIVEASFGLGEVVVSGKVTPDRFVLEHATGAVLHRHLGRKTIQWIAGEEVPIPAEQQKVFCLSDVELGKLAELGRRVEKYFVGPRDIEWAWGEDQFHLLQARPITTTAAEREDIRREVIQQLRQQLDGQTNVWVRYNLSEVLPQPTPMTWAVVQRLLAADGGVGNMNRDLGGQPDPALGSLSGFDLIAGRPMANLARMPRLQYTNPPIEYPFEEYRNNPRLALDPKPIVNPMRDGVLSGLMRLPTTMWQVWRMAKLAPQLAETFTDEYYANVLPGYLATVRQAHSQDWSSLDPFLLQRQFNEWITKTLVDFARHSLKPTFFAELAWNALTDQLKLTLSDERARQAVSELAMHARTDAEKNLSVGFRELAQGVIDRKTFLQRFGHRGANEMELSSPRWYEEPAFIPTIPPGTLTQSPTRDPLDRIIEEARFSQKAEKQFRKQCDQFRTFLALREEAKNDLLKGYAILRKVLVEFDRRYKLQGGVFFLVPAELNLLIQGHDLTKLISARRKKRQLELTLELPPVLLSENLDAIGRPLPIPDGKRTLEGSPLSPGSAEGTVLVLTSPNEQPNLENDFVLVCPSTDPSWVPLFASARGLIMETGGVLSHGAIVAREFGIPAVAGLPDATRTLQTGQRVRVDGSTGLVVLL